ncbi:trigger factor [Mycoplasmatota bacterium]|nr:trigger factor [Mycoplasmatota bacterium]
MTVKVEKIEENKVKLTVTVEAEAFNEALDVAFKKVVKEVSVPGFRKGKIPRNLFEKKFGVESLYEEAINHIIPKVYPDAVLESKIEPVAQPNIDVDFETIGKDQPFTFYATVTVKPEVKLGDYKGIEVKELSTEVTDEDVDAEIKKLLDQHAELVVKESEAENLDTVVIDYEGIKDGVAFEGGTAQNHSLKLGSNSFIPGFEEQLIGIKAGESKTINVTFPEEYHSEDLKGQEVQFNVTCHEVKTLEVPAFDEDFVKELNRENINTVDELKEDVKNTLTNKKETEAKNHIVDTVVDTAANNAEINVPDEMIKAETDRMMHDATKRLEQQGINLDLYLQYTGGTKEGLQEQFKGEATKQIRYNLTLEKIAEVENIEVTAEELDEEFEKMAKAYNMPIDQIKAAFPDTTDLEDNIKIRKAVDFLVENTSRI